MPDRRWTEEHGADGLRRKFDVYKSADEICDDPSPRNSMAKYPVTARIGADGEFIMVLRPETDQAAFGALAHYANAVRDRSPKLAEDIDAQLDRIWDENHV